MKCILDYKNPEIHIEYDAEVIEIPIIETKYISILDDEYYVIKGDASNGFCV